MRAEENMRGKQREKGKCYGQSFFTSERDTSDDVEGRCGECRERVGVECEATHGHRLPLIESTRFLIPPNRDLLLLREPEFEVDSGSSAVEKPIFASLLARAICCDRSCSTFGGTRSESSRVDGAPRECGGPWNDRLSWTHNSGEESAYVLVDTGGG